MEKSYVRIYIYYYYYYLLLYIYLYPLPTLHSFLTFYTQFTPVVCKSVKTARNVVKSAIQARIGTFCLHFGLCKTSVKTFFYTFLRIYLDVWIRFHTFVSQSFTNRNK